MELIGGVCVPTRSYSDLEPRLNSESVQSEMPDAPTMKCFATISHKWMKSLVKICDLALFQQFSVLGGNKELSAIVAAVNPLDPFKPRIPAKYARRQLRR
jgi:hypothetical protein